MADIKYDIVEHLAELSVGSNGWKKELNRVSWNSAPAKYDLRSWSPDYTKMSKGITFSDDEAKLLFTALGKQLHQ